MILLYWWITLFFVKNFVEGKKMQIRKWSETSDLIIAALKVFSVKLFVIIRFIGVAILLVTLVGLLMVGIIPFWYLIL